jgi:hypothetical protein
VKVKCPSCHAEHPLDAMLDGQAGSELMRLMADLEPVQARPLMAYLGLFRSVSRALSWDRAVRLAGEALALETDRQRLAAALSKTVTVLREKQGPGWKPLTNHNYLAKVLNEMPAETASSVPALIEAPTTPAHNPPPKTQTGQAMMNLEALKRGSR